jgi:hypothetical protein
MKNTLKRMKLFFILVIFLFLITIGVFSTQNQNQIKENNYDKLANSMYSWSVDIASNKSQEESSSTSSTESSSPELQKLETITKTVTNTITVPIKETQIIERETIKEVQINNSPSSSVSSPIISSSSISKIPFDWTQCKDLLKEGEKIKSEIQKDYNNGKFNILNYSESKKIFNEYLNRYNYLIENQNYPIECRNEIKKQTENNELIQLAIKLFL